MAKLEGEDGSLLVAVNPRGGVVFRFTENYPVTMHSSNVN